MQFFKGDPIELKMKAVADPVFDQIGRSLDDFFENGFNCAAYLLMLYDEGRVPFSNTVNRETFVDFIRVALKNFPFTGNFESYIFVLKAIFGDETEIIFDVPSPGKLSIDVLASTGAEFEFIAREFIDGVYQDSNIVDDLGNILIFRGIPGISNAYEIGLLFSELMPNGIVPDINLGFYTKSDWVAEFDDGDLYDLIDHEGNQLIFFETGV